ncbi:MAG: TOBE domain-containing protein [Haliea sp.]|nr:MAG: TOBE domain-containing protein [Haliea sp.]
MTMESIAGFLRPPTEVASDAFLAWADGEGGGGKRGFDTSRIGSASPRAGGAPLSPSRAGSASTHRSSSTAVSHPHTTRGMSASSHTAGAVHAVGDDAAAWHTSEMHALPFDTIAALGRALVSQAKVCLMDEPLSNLDAQLRQEMRSELRQLQQRLGLTVVYVTHDQAEAMSMADQVVLLHKGRVEQAATPRELYAQPATTFAASFIGTPSMNLLRLDGDRIAGSTVATGRSAQWLGVRPEAVTLGGSVPAAVRSIEYLGADLILRCAVGSETLTVRTDGQARLEPGSAVLLDWAANSAHHFDAQGRRLA